MRFLQKEAYNNTMKKDQEKIMENHKEGEPRDKK